MEASKGRSTAFNRQVACGSRPATPQSWGGSTTGAFHRIRSADRLRHPPYDNGIVGWKPRQGRSTESNRRIACGSRPATPQSWGGSPTRAFHRNRSTDRLRHPPCDTEFAGWKPQRGVPPKPIGGSPSASALRHRNPGVEAPPGAFHRNRSADRLRHPPYDNGIVGWKPPRGFHRNQAADRLRHPPYGFCGRRSPAVISWLPAEAQSLG